MTAPSACRDYDYERLEFYGDSIIGFLVILELFLTKQNSQEGDLDFLRIDRVSNQNFYKVNEAHGFFRFMVTDPHHVFSGFLPSAFEHADTRPNYYSDRDSRNSLCYQTKITQKTFNELNNKFKELKKIRVRLALADSRQDNLIQLFNRGDPYSLVQIILKDASMTKRVAKAVGDQGKRSAFEDSRMVANELESLTYRSDTESVLYACKLIYQSGLTPVQLLNLCINVSHDKI